MNKNEALKMAIEALLYGTDHTNAVKACKEALEAEQVCQEDSRVHQNDVPAQQPVAWVAEDVLDKQFVEGRPRRVWYECNEGVGFKIYTRPHQDGTSPSEARDKEFVTFNEHSDELAEVLIALKEWVISAEMRLAKLEQALKEKNS